MADTIRITHEDLQKPLPEKPEGGKSAIVLTEGDLKKVAPPKPSEQLSPKAAVDVMLVIDSSGSMEATDFEPNRFEAAKWAARAFVQRKVVKRYNDRVGVMTFGGSATPVIAPISDLVAVDKALQGLYEITHTGTALGTALEAAAEELQRAGGRRRAIILLSDGDHWAGSDPVPVAKGLKNIKVFTIGLGTVKGAVVNLPGLGRQTVRLNEKILQDIAHATGAAYYHAPGMEQLMEIYRNLADF